MSIGAFGGHGLRVEINANLPIRNWSHFEASRQARLFRLEVHTNQAVANPKFGSILKHRRAHAFFFVEGPVGRVHVFQIDERVPHFQQAMMPGNFRVV